MDDIPNKDYVEKRLLRVVITKDAPIYPGHCGYIIGTGPPGWIRVELFAKRPDGMASDEMAERRIRITANFRGEEIDGVGP